MKKFIIIAFSLIFLLFALGSAITVRNLLAITTDLRNLIDLHEIEDIRQELGFSIQRIQTYTYASATDFSKNLDDIINHASVVDETIERCHDCHHVPSVQKELDETEQLISEYEEKLSYLITFVSSKGERRLDKQEEISALGDIIMNKVQGMVHRAGSTIATRTTQAMQDIDRSYMILAATLFFTFLAAFYVAKSLTRHVTAPIDELLTAAQKIADGELGYVTTYKAGSEFGRLIKTFNDMSLSLANKETKIQSNLSRLVKLNKVTLPLHAAQDISAILKYMWTSIAEVVGVRKTGIMLMTDQAEEFTLEISSAAIVPPKTTSVTMLREDVLQTFKKYEGKPILHNKNDDNGGWPFTNRPNLNIHNFIIIWLVHDNELTGALFAINKNEGNFLEEDQNILGILANNISVALENIRLYHDLQFQMEELKNTQRQLVEAEKLTALGTLAGGIAHDFNNILCGMIGYIALLKKNHSPGEHEFEILNTIEQAGFRAATLIKQLLTFARQEMFELQPIAINDDIHNVIALLKNTISKLITINLDLDPSLPAVLGDPAQLEQVIMNLCVNARDAMPDGGKLCIKSKEVHLSEDFCQQHADARPGYFIKVTVTDSGTGIEDTIISRIFEPFFTTKEFGKGTGLGLSMVYGIIRSHEGFCSIDSTSDKGTSFSFYLPIPTKKIQLQKIPLTKDKPPILLAAGKTILIVDDEETIVSMLTIHLENAGCTVYHASNGYEGLQILTEHLDKIDLIILDINMPVMGGKEAYLKMKEISPRVKVLIATGYAYSGHAKQMIDHGADDFIQKPFNPEEITAKIDSLLS